MTTEITTRYNVTDEQIAAAHRFVDYSKHQVIFQVESASEVGVEYTVYYHQVLRHLVCNCKAGQVGTPCWHKRAACAAAAEFKVERNAMEEVAMAELQAEINAECCAYGAYTVVTDETSSSLDGVTFEVAPSGRMVPMR